MPTLHVCSLSHLPEVLAATQASHLVTLVGATAAFERPAGIAAERHLVLSMSDIVEPLDGHVMPDESHVEALLAFVRSWPREEPLVLHCWAGISRSTAAAYIAACALAPERDEAEIARALRAAAPSATPNRRLVALADTMLGREGRMISAIAAIGRGAEAFEGTPFTLRLS
ncbi:MAG TPA: protein tyrosine phosphatase [Beijerinckiaceae bacterium]|jgi:predicted protein tyrosine phosphatase